MAKWFWKRWWDFSALGSPARSVSRRVAIHYFFMPLPPQKRPWAQNLKGCNMAMIFWD